MYTKEPTYLTVLHFVGESVGVEGHITYWPHDKPDT